MSIKVIRFLPVAPPVDPRTPITDRSHRPDAPDRVTLATALDLAGLPPPRFAAIEIVWASVDAAGTPPDEAMVAGRRDEGVIAVPVDEVVVRGAEALTTRWADAGERFKMMSVGRRNPALTRAEFVERWRTEAGRLGGDRIPDELRGLAYVQNHPRGDDPPFDAINEVWFDRLDDLRRRAEWFAARPIPADLMSPADCWSLYLRETLVVPARR